MGVARRAARRVARRWRPAAPVPAAPAQEPDESTRARMLAREGELAALALNVKTLGYELARRQLHEVLDHVDPAGEPQAHDLVSGLATQRDVESTWFAHWCREMRCRPLYHRKLWELASVAQVLFEHGMLQPGTRGVGFGCGEEPLASLFAAMGASIVITDLDDGEAAERGWVDTGQHAGSLAQSFKPDIVDRATFDAHVTHRVVDMTDVPHDLDGLHDFCWSVCAMEHLGDIEAGLRFVERSVDLLRPGGVAVHTTEFNHLDREPNVVTGPTVYYRRRHVEDLAARLARRGARLLGPDFSVGDGALDRFIDLPPYQLGEGLMHAEAFYPANQLAHLKIVHDGIPCTCYRLIIVKDA